MRIARRLFLTYVHPLTSIGETASSGTVFRDGFLCMLCPAIGYQLMYIMLAKAGGAPSTFTPWLAIPKEVYYLANRFLIVPSLLLCWFFASAVLHSMLYALSGRGSFESVLGSLGHAVAVSMSFTLVHDLAMSLASVTGIIDPTAHEVAMNSPGIWRNILWLSFALYVGYFVLTFTVVARVTHRLSWFTSAITGVASFVCFQTVFLVFNR